MTKQEIKYFFVDLDGTFAKNDLFQELLFKRFVKKPLETIYILITEGALGLKHIIFDNHTFSVDQIIVNRNVLRLIKRKKESGYHIFLATASPQVYADYILKTWSVFDLAQGSDQKVNLKGKSKLDLITSISKGAHFEYIGDSRDDQVIFNKCARYYKLTNRIIYEFNN
jgi:hypothetical protein